MPVLTVRQSVTQESMVQIEIANTSGMDVEQQPCSVIFSLRSSHPHFFYYRGSSSEGRSSPPPVASEALAPPTPTSTEPSRAAAASLLERDCAGDAMTLKAISVAETLRWASDEVWTACGLPPIGVGAPAQSPSHHGGGSDGGSAATSNGGGRGRDPHASPAIPMGFQATSLSERPLLIKEELPDGVLMPGEVRVFLLDPDDPEYLSGILAREQEQQELSRRQRREMLLGEFAAGRGRGNGNGAGRVVNFAPGVKGAFSMDLTPPNGHDPGAPSATPDTMDEPLTTSSDITPTLRDRRYRNGAYPVEEADERFALHPTSPLSITRDSTHTKDSPGTDPGDGRLSSGSAKGLPGSEPAAALHHRGSAAGGSPHSSSDPAMGSSTAGSRWGTRSPMPAFYVYYERLGDEDRCAETARAWLRKEDRKYKAWSEGYIASVAQLERQRRRAYGVAGEKGDGSGEGGDPLEGDSSNEYNASLLTLRGLRILPPVLGEDVRWRRNGKSDGGLSSRPSMQNAYSASAFYYYYGFLFHHTEDVDGRSGKRRPLKLPSVPSLLGGAGGGRASELHRGPVSLPPPFSSVHANSEVSKTASKMFKRSRMGAGAVVFFLKGNPQKRLRSALKAGWFDRGVGRGPTPYASPPSPKPTALPLFTRPASTSSTHSSAPPSPAAGEANGRNHKAMEGGGEGNEGRRRAVPAPRPAADPSLEPPPISLHGRVRSGRGLALFDDSTHNSGNGMWEGHGSLGSSRGERERSRSPSTNSADAPIYNLRRTSTLEPSSVSAIVDQLDPPPPPPPPLDSNQSSGSPLSFSAAKDLANSRPSLPSFFSPGAAVPTPKEGSGSSVGPAGDGRSTHSPDFDDSQLRRTAELWSSGSKSFSSSGGFRSYLSPMNSSGESFVNMSFAKLNEVMNYWLKYSEMGNRGEKGNERERFAEGTAEHDDGDGGGNEGGGAHSRGGGRVLTVAPPSSIRAGFNANAVPVKKDQRVNANRDGGSSLTVSPVLQRLVQISARAGNGAAVCVAEGVRLSTPFLLQALGFLMNTVFGSAVPHAASVVYTFVTETLLTPQNVGTLLLLVMPVLTVVSLLVLLWAVWVATGNAGAGAGVDTALYDSPDIL